MDASNSDRYIQKKEILNYLEVIPLIDLEYYAYSHREVIKNLYENGDLTDEEIESALEKAVLNQAHKDYNYLIERRNFGETVYADHVGRTDCFAYALVKKEFSEQEIREIPFDHGENPEIYVQLYFDRNLIDSLRKRFLNPKVQRWWFESSDPHP